MRNRRFGVADPLLAGVEHSNRFVGEDGAGIHTDDAAAEVVDDFAVVGSDKGGDAVAVDFEQQAHDLARVRRVDAVGGFIAKQDVGLGYDGAGEGDLALFAARELAGEALGFVRQSHPLEHLVYSHVDLAIGAPADLERQADVFPNGSVGQQAGVLEDDADAAAELGEGCAANPGDIDAVDEDDAGVERFLAQENAEQGGLARAVGADQEGELAAGDGNGDIGEGRLAVVALGDSLDDDQRRTPVRRPLQNPRAGARKTLTPTLSPEKTFAKP